jgi:hypothetical protein
MTTENHRDAETSRGTQKKSGTMGFIKEIGRDVGTDLVRETWNNDQVGSWWRAYWSRRSRRPRIVEVRSNRPCLRRYCRRSRWRSRWRLVLLFRVEAKLEGLALKPIQIRSY